MTMQFSVALFAGMAAAMLVPPVRRSVPRWIEALIWLGLIVACWMAVTNLQQSNTRQLTEAAVWGADQIVNTAFGLVFAGLVVWIADHRFAIANVVVVVLAVDILLLALVRSHRKAEAQQPRIMLGEWIEFPLFRKPALAPVAVPYALDEWNRRAERATAILGAAFLTWLVTLLIWTRDVVVPRARARQARAVAAGRVHTAAGLESLRERAVQLQVAAHAWQTEHAPAIAGFATKAGHLIDRVGLGGVSLGDYSAGRVMTDEQVSNIRALLSAQSIGWYGPIVPAPPGLGPAREEGGEHESDRLAS